MIAFPNIKINLGLSITEKRPDGYHNLETVFYPVALEDALEIRTSPNADRKFTLHQHGMEIAGNPEDNLVVKAYLLMDKEFHLPPVEIHLYKHIPSGAGLGGGSSDAAFMLKLLNDHYHWEYPKNNWKYTLPLWEQTALSLSKTDRYLPRELETSSPRSNFH